VASSEQFTDTIDSGRLRQKLPARIEAGRMSSGPRPSGFTEESTMLPTFIVIGAMKGGTSSLHRYLAAHPEICMSSTKETDFFVAEKNYSLGTDWYESQFCVPARHRGEASPNYTKWPYYAGVPERMHALVPDARLIYVVRDPVDRMISHFGHRVSKQSEARPIDNALQPTSKKYLAPSQYYTQLQQFQQYYPPERIMVVASEDLRDERRATLRSIFKFLEVDPTFDSEKFNREHHRTVRKFQSSWGQRFLARIGLPVKEPKTLPLPSRQVAEQTRQALIECLRPEVEALRSLTGQRFDRWCL
jgi:hypothetical protein